MAGYLRKEWRKVKRHYRPPNLLNALLFNRRPPTVRGIFGYRVVASWKRDSETGAFVRTTGLRRTKDGLVLKRRGRK